MEKVKLNGIEMWQDKDIIYLKKNNEKIAIQVSKDLAIKGIAATQDGDVLGGLIFNLKDF